MTEPKTDRAWAKRDAERILSERIVVREWEYNLARAYLDSERELAAARRCRELLATGPLLCAAKYGPDFDLEAATDEAFAEWDALAAAKEGR